VLVSNPQSSDGFASVFSTLPCILRGRTIGRRAIAHFSPTEVARLRQQAVIDRQIGRDGGNCNQLFGAEATERAGASAVYLPLFSSDLNPIEQVFAKRRGEICKRPPGRSPPTKRSAASGWSSVDRSGANPLRCQWIARMQSKMLLYPGPSASCVGRRTVYAPPNFPTIDTRLSFALRVPDNRVHER